MAEFKIPEEHVEAFVKYLSFSNELKGEFLSILKQSEIGITVSDLIENAQKKISSEAELIPTLTDAVVSMLITSEHFEDDGLVKLIGNNLCEKDSKLDYDKVISELKILIDASQKLVLSVKGEQLAFNRERLLADTRIITDVRPVFAENGDENIQASVLMHTLKLTFYQNNQKSVEYIALDETDLESLKGQIERAQNKRKSIEAMLNKLEVKLIKY